MAEFGACAKNRGMRRIAQLSDPGPWPIPAPRMATRVFLGSGGMRALDSFWRLSEAGLIPGVSNLYRARSVAAEALLRAALGLAPTPKLPRANRWLEDGQARYVE
jgi:hypothetical protein